MKFKKATRDLDLKSNDRLYLKNRSPFAPKHYKDLKPNGFKIFTFNSGFKKKKDDLLIIVFDQAVNVACKYSLTTMPSAPIIWDKKNNEGNCRALIVNSGNANAHTGKQGLKNINMYVSHLAKFLECSKKEILVSSTGVIGEQIDPNLISKKIKLLSSSKEKNLIDASRSICTTDTFVKTAVHNVNIDSKNIKVYGFAKGSGMISPNMGTMLVYIFIDCEIAKDKLKKLLSENLEETFNSITVDSDTSTSDSVYLVATGRAKHALISDPDSPAAASFSCTNGRREATGSPMLSIKPWGAAPVPPSALSKVMKSGADASPRAWMASQKSSSHAVCPKTSLMPVGFPDAVRTRSIRSSRESASVTSG